MAEFHALATPKLSKSDVEKQQREKKHLVSSNFIRDCDCGAKVSAGPQSCRAAVGLGAGDVSDG